MTKTKHPKRSLAPLDLRAQDHYEEMLTVSNAAQLSGFTKQGSYGVIDKGDIVRTAEHDYLTSKGIVEESNAGK